MENKNEKECDKCGEKMIDKRIQKIGNNVWTEYTCSRNNCIRHSHPLIEKVNTKNC